MLSIPAKTKLLPKEMDASIKARLLNAPLDTGMCNSVLLWLEHVLALPMVKETGAPGKPVSVAASDTASFGQEEFLAFARYWYPWKAFDSALTVRVFVAKPE